MTDMFDIAVIGAGIAGASVAAELARTHRVAVLERESMPGYHSTGRSAALFSEIYGNAVVRALSRASRDFFYNPPHGFSPDPLVRRRGSLYIADRTQLAALDDFASNPDMAHSVQRIAPGDAHTLCPILRPDYVAGAMLEADAADVDVHALHQGYLRQFRARGGTLVSDAGVSALEHDGRLWRATTAAGVFSAPVIVNAAGAWADDVAALAGARRLGIQPKRRTALLVDIPDAVGLDNWPMTIDIDEKFYFKPDAGLLLISPADETPVPASDIQPEEMDVALAVDRVERATTIKIERVRKKWAGLRSFAPDRAPVAGFDPARPGFFWLAGQGGYGIQTAPALSALAALLVRRETPAGALDGFDVNGVSPARLKP